MYKIKMCARDCSILSCFALSFALMLDRDLVAGRFVFGPMSTALQAISHFSVDGCMLSLTSLYIRHAARTAF
jgi:hypothetical protein